MRARVDRKKDLRGACVTDEQLTLRVKKTGLPRLNTTDRFDRFGLRSNGLTKLLLRWLTSFFFAAFALGEAVVPDFLVGFALSAAEAGAFFLEVLVQPLLALGFLIQCEHLFAIGEFGFREQWLQAQGLPPCHASSS